MLRRLARAHPPHDERHRQRRHHQGARQPAELRDGEVFRQRGARGARATTSALARYERAAVRVQVSLNMLNIGQACDHRARPDADHAAGGAAACAPGTMTVGQFVLVNTYLMQLYQPLGFLGFVYMTIKQGLVDMEQMFRLLEVERRRSPIGRARGARCASVRGARRRGAVRERAFRLPAGPRDPEGRRLHRAGRRTAGDRRADRRGQVHHQPTAVPLLRRDRRAAS